VSTIVEHVADAINLKIAARVRGERASRRWSLDELSERSQVSKAMISRIERAEVSPTAALLGRLSGAFGITLSLLLTDHEQARGPVRRADQPVWRDPATGYVRRQVSASTKVPIELTEVDLPPGASVSLPASAYAFIAQVMWVLSGRLSFVEDGVTVDIGPGDSYELGAPVDRTFRNDGAEPCRYLVVVLRQ
jgi:transcriptional regulator with XRE-family HTH domain